MERLTDTKGLLCACMNELCAFEPIQMCSDCKYQDEANKRLATYEEAEEQGRILTPLELAQTTMMIQTFHKYHQAEQQGRLVVLPLKIGDKVYDKYFHLHEWDVTEIDIHKDTVVFRLGNQGTDNYAAFHLYELGDRFSLTRAEAEAALNGE